VVDIRARELGIDLIYQGALKKLDSYEDAKQKTELEDHQIAYIGDDLIDVPIMRRVGFSAAPSDSLPEVLETVDFVSAHQGGKGAVREVCDLILKGRGLWDQVKVRYEL